MAVQTTGQARSSLRHWPQSHLVPLVPVNNYELETSCQVQKCAIVPDTGLFCAICTSRKSNYKIHCHNMTTIVTMTTAYFTSELCIWAELPRLGPYTCSNGSLGPR